MRLFAISMIAMGVASVIVSIVVTTAVLGPDREPISTQRPVQTATTQWNVTVERN